MNVIRRLSELVDEYAATGRENITDLSDRAKGSECRKEDAGSDSDG